MAAEMDIVNQFGPWGIVVVGAGLALKFMVSWATQMNERYVQLVEQTATALEKVATHLPEIERQLKDR